MTDPQPTEPPAQPTPEAQPIGAEYIPFGPVQTNVHEAVVAADGSVYVPFTVKIPGVSFSFALDVEHARRFSANIASKAVAGNGKLTIARSMPPEPPHR